LHTRNEQRDFLLVGVTGGIGSGKSLVCGVFERLERTVVSADALAREITDTDPAVKAEVRALLGNDVYRTDGSLDRKLAATRVFADPLLVRKLNRIVHPRVFEALERRLAALPADRRRPYVVVEAALIYESGLDRTLDRVIVVDAPEEERIRRVAARDGVTEQDVRLRMAAQLAPAKKASKADFVIVNDRNAISLDDKVRFIDGLLRSLGVDRPSTG
jgi:dephospho-CoA kinase